MTTRISEAWSTIVESLWFLPTIMTVLSVLLSIATLWIDSAFSVNWGAGRSLVYAGGVAGGREVLSTIAGSMMTVTGVMFSVTIVTLSLASNQYGPRLLRNFLRDRGNQIVLGIFIGTFTYCLLVLRTLREVEDTTVVPEVSITVGVLLALVSLGALIFFIHHISESIQASSILAGVGNELDSAIELLFPEEMGTSQPMLTNTSAPQPGDSYGHPPQAVTIADAGYIRAIDNPGLMNTARECDVVIRLEYGPGAFIYGNSQIATVWAGTQIDENLLNRIRAAFILGHQRTTYQDVDYLLSQLVQPALLALSPGVNNSLVAITAIDWMGAAMAKLAARQEPSDYRHDDDGALRVIATSVTFSSFVESAFNPLRESARSNTLVTMHLLDTILALTPHITTASQRETLRRHATLIEHNSQEGIASEYDRSRIQGRAREIMRALSVEHPINVDAETC